VTDDAQLRSEADRYLIDAIRGGDTGAYRQLVDRFSGRLTACAARRLSGTGLDPEDAVQETFVGLLQSISRLDGVRSLEAYLFRILRNKISDLTGKRPEAHGLHRVPLAGNTDDSRESTRGYDPVAGGASPSTYMRRGEAVDVRNTVLADILEVLIGTHKEERNYRDLKILELLFHSSWPGRDIAAAVGTSEPTVTRAKQTALERLARLARQHPRMDTSLKLFEENEDLSNLIRLTWSDNLLSCLKRNTVGAYALGVLDSDLNDYVAFHLEIVGCEVCSSNLEDLKREQESASSRDDAKERLFASSIGFLKKLR
jgi:RNA polymerase sigma-70 factor (ECF subfamily)